MHLSAVHPIATTAAGRFAVGVIAAATETPRGKRSHAVGAHVLPRVMGGGLSSKIVGSQHHGSVGLGLLFEELT